MQHPIHSNIYSRLCACLCVTALIGILFSGMAVAGDDVISDGDGEIFEKKKAARVRELESYEQIDGEWEGTYFLTAYPESLKEQIQENITGSAGVGLKVQFENGTARVAYRWDQDGPWDEVDGEIELIADQIGWHIYVARAGGVWLERVWLSFSRIEENKAYVTVTRNVHNWMDTGVPDFITTYHCCPTDLGPCYL